MKIELLRSMGDEHADAAIRSVIGTCQCLFPERILTYFVHGSYSDGSALPDSDIDLGLIFRGCADSVELARVDSIASDVSHAGKLRVDILSFDEASFASGVAPGLKTALVVYGAQIPSDLPLQPIEKKIWRSVGASFRYACRLRHGAQRLCFPLGYPDPSGEFFGYERWGIATREADACRPGTRALVNVICMHATSLVAMIAGQQVAKKSASAAAYRQYIGDEWSDYVGEVYDFCKSKWQYQLPLLESDRQQLRAICERALFFENHFLARCRPLLLSALEHADENTVVAAVQLLSRISYPEEEFTRALHRYKSQG